ncbi:hypothetical protein ISCGN_004716 [Ixodes scapularis]
MRRPTRRARRRRLRRASCEPCDVTAPRACGARSMAHYGNHAELLNLGLYSSRHKKPEYGPAGASVLPRELSCAHRVYSPLRTCFQKNRFEKLAVDELAFDELA